MCIRTPYTPEFKPQMKSEAMKANRVRQPSVIAKMNPLSREEWPCSFTYVNIVTVQVSVDSTED